MPPELHLHGYLEKLTPFELIRFGVDKKTRMYASDEHLWKRFINEVPEGIRKRYKTSKDIFINEPIYRKYEYAFQIKIKPEQQEEWKKFHRAQAKELQDLAHQKYKDETSRKRLNNCLTDLYSIEGLFSNGKFDYAIMRDLINRSSFQEADEWVQIFKNPVIYNLISDQILSPKEIIKTFRVPTDRDNREQLMGLTIQQDLFTRIFEDPHYKHLMKVDKEVGSKLLEHFNKVLKSNPSIVSKPVTTEGIDVFFKQAAETVRELYKIFIETLDNKDLLKNKETQKYTLRT